MEEDISNIDDIGIDLPDIPMPDENAQTQEIEDEFEGAYKFAIIGVGQGGSRIAETFWNLGYRRVCVINTAKQDLKYINIPEDRNYYSTMVGQVKILRPQKEFSKRTQRRFVTFFVQN